MCTCSLVILAVRMMSSIIRTNISSTNVDGTTVMMMIMVDNGRLVGTSSCVGRKGDVEVNVTGCRLPACKTWHESWQINLLSL